MKETWKCIKCGSEWLIPKCLDCGGEVKKIEQTSHHTKKQKKKQQKDG
jgi:predicted nucleic-acid-binding Zn-ribbon protein